MAKIAEDIITYKGKKYISAKGAAEMIGTSTATMRMWRLRGHYFASWIRPFRKKVKGEWQGVEWVYYPVDNVKKFAKWYDPNKAGHLRYGFWDTTARF